MNLQEEKRSLNELRIASLYAIEKIEEIQALLERETLDNQTKKSYQLIEEKELKRLIRRVKQLAASYGQ